MKVVQGVLKRMTAAKGYMKLSVAPAGLGKKVTYKLSADMRHLLNEQHLDGTMTLHIDENSFVQDVQHEAADTPADAIDDSTPQGRRLKLVQYVLARDELVNLDTDATVHIFETALARMEEAGQSLEDAVDEALKTYMDSEGIVMEKAPPVVSAKPAKRRAAKAKATMA